MSADITEDCLYSHRLSAPSGDMHFKNKTGSIYEGNEMRMCLRESARGG